MTGYLLSPLAQADIDEIWEYSAKQWSVAQAERYVRVIQSAIEIAAANPKRGRACDEIRNGYFKLATGSHVLFYRIVGAKIDIARILHQSMDFERHL
ncbi:MAG TPA: type II toxin-antitoxin system RelE/ParE family toxin [Rhizomicrobium sp.]|nr:type II toxin-antitoxin system RelE/ParE family toxin [Rhizomicrobium sp.]